MPRVALPIAEHQSSRSACSETLLVALLVTVALIPLPLGGNRPWAWEVLGAFIGLLLTLSGICALLRPNELTPSRRLRVPALLFAAVVSWATLQCLPFTPEAWHHPLWSQAQDYLGLQIVPSISINRIASISRIFRLM